MIKITIDKPYSEVVSGINSKIKVSTEPMPLPGFLYEAEICGKIDEATGELWLRKTRRKFTGGFYSTFRGQIVQKNDGTEISGKFYFPRRAKIGLVAFLGLSLINCILTFIHTRDFKLICTPALITGCLAVLYVLGLKMNFKCEERELLRFLQTI